MDIKNKENKYIYIIVLICILIGMLIGANIQELTHNNVIIESNLDTEIIELPNILQSVNINTNENKDENELNIELKININTATKEELMTLPGIAEVLASNIIKYREEKGLFNSISELINVDRIGNKTYEKIKDKVVL